MQRRHQFTNIPIEIMRSAVCISDTGSITKAANILGLSQPAISAQIKRIESLVGGSLFQRTANGSTPTELGKLVLTHARKILDANDQLLRLRGASSDEQSIRIGLSNVFAATFFGTMTKRDLAGVSVYSDNSAEIAKGLLDGFIDIGLFFYPADIAVDPGITVTHEREEELVWVRASSFVVSPGSPLPLLTWPGQISHDLMIAALERQGLVYRFAFTSPDLHALLEAAKAGFGLTVLPRRMVPPSLLHAHEYYLPPIPAPRLFLCVRSSVHARTERLINEMASRIFNSSAPLLAKGA
jgi:DNA-binding transcriptional LysR family regulator